MARLSRVARLTEDVTPLLLPSHYTKEDRLNLAVEAMRESGYLADGRTVLSTRSAAQLYNVPPSTLHTRFSGKATSRENAHIQQQALSPDQEEVLIRFIRESSWRGVPATKQSIRTSASQICGGYIGQNWVDRFLDRHPDVKRKVTQPLEACRAKALNRHNVDDFFDKLIDIITHYDIPLENIYNMDEKGVQLGQGGKVLAIVDRELKTAYQIEEGSREMVTVIETVSADGSALDPMVIFPLKRHDLSCKKDNDCHASIAFSENGWTDQELGTDWMKKVFEPLSAARNTSGRHRLLILDGHNSHCSYDFCAYAEAHDIIIICLPPHTTHALQPCDVGVFGPLASSWAAVVNEISRLHQVITKQTFLKHYSVARRRAMQPWTIRAAFKKCGIYPTDRNAIPESSFAPALNTSIEAPSAVPLDFPSILEPIPEDAEILSTRSSASNQASRNSIQVAVPYDTDGIRTPPLSTASTLSAASSLSATSTSSVASTLSAASSAASQLSPHSDTFTPMNSPSPRYRIAGIPAPLKHTASCHELRARNTLLLGILVEAEAEMGRKHAQLVLLEAENAALRQSMEMRKPKQKIHSSEEAAKARVLTDHESLVLLGRAVYRKVVEGHVMKAKLKERRKKVEDQIRVVVEQRKDEERAQKVAERAAEKDRKEREAELIKQIRLEERQRKKALAEEAKRAKEQAAAEKKRKAAEKKAAREQAKKRGKARAPQKPDGNGSDSSNETVDDTDDILGLAGDLGFTGEVRVQTDTVTESPPTPPACTSESSASSSTLEISSIGAGSSRSAGSWWRSRHYT